MPYCDRCSRIVVLRYLVRPLAFALCLALASTAFAGDETSDVRRILIVYENESTLFANMEVSRGLHGSLSDLAPTKFEFYSEYLDIVRFQSRDHLRRLTENMVAKYKDVSLDVVMAVGPGALQFMFDHRSEIAPDTPLIFGGVSNESLKSILLPADARGVISRFDVIKTIDLALRLQPDAKEIIVLTGSSGFDRRWEATARRDLTTRYEGLEVNYLTGLTLEGFEEAARKLSPDTILLILTVLEDADGRKYVPRDAALEIASVSGAPSYSVYSSYIGAGVVGGFMETFESIGEDMATLAGQVVSGTAPASQIIPSSGRAVVDWRQMKRWGIDSARLPEGAQLQFYEPSVWERYRLQIIGALAIIMLQSGTIAGLIILDRRRRKIEEELALERLELAHLSRTAQLGELSGAFAHELNQPLTSILANAEVGARLLDKDPIDLGEIRNILDDIVADDKRAAAVIAQLRQLMVKGESTLGRLDLNEAVTATLALARSELLSRQTKVDFDGEQELPVRGNLAQLQQIILNLTMNAADAMSHLPPSERRIEIATRKRDDGFREMAITDRGCGISPEMRAKVFKPFVSTKTKGLGLGLAICRSIALAHGGTIEFDEHKTDGAQVVLALPPI